MVRVKICGITNLEDAKLALSAGSDALGFVFYKKSLRYITPGEASRIIGQLPKGTIKIGVFVNARENSIRNAAKLCRLDMLQFHGSESAQFCRKFKNYKIIKAFRVKDKVDLNNILSYKTFAYLFDTFVPSKIGGTGKKFDWQLLGHLSGIKQPIFLSGGLNAENIKGAIQAIRPDWVDVSSSVEARPGKKDPHKVKELIKAVNPQTFTSRGFLCKGVGGPDKAGKSAQKTCKT